MESPASFASALSTVLDHHPRAVLLVDASRRVLYDNHAARELMQRRCGVAVADGRLCLANPANRAAFEQLLLDLARDRGGRGAEGPNSRGLRVASADQSCLVVMHRVADPVEPGAERLVLVEITAGRQQPERSASLLADLFGATRREVSVAAALIRGDGVEGASKALGITIETVRSHAKSLFRKCDVHSRADLIALIGSLSQFAGADPATPPLPPLRHLARPRLSLQAATSTATRAARPLPISSAVPVPIPIVR